MTIQTATRPAAPQLYEAEPKSHLKPLAARLASPPAGHANQLRTHPGAALRIIANDLRRLAADLDLLAQPDEVPPMLASLVTAVMTAVGRPAPPLTIAPIVDATCAAFHVTHDEIVSRRRGQHVATARQVAIYLSREITDYSFPRIAEYFGRDHSTAIHSYAQIARRIAGDSSFSTLIRTLKQTIAARHDDTSSAAAKT